LVAGRTLPEACSLFSDGVLGASAILVRHLSETNPFALVIGFGLMAIIIVPEQLDKRIPGALIGLGVATAAAALTDLERRGVTVIGTVSSDLPTAALPDIQIGQWVRLMPLSLIIAIIVMMQTAATTRSFPSDPAEPPDVDRDFVGVGVGSILAGFFGAFPEYPGVSGRLCPPLATRQISMSAQVHASYAGGVCDRRGDSTHPQKSTGHPDLRMSS
jgi:MFS superfamily sulfate permease-like transporter